ncbi:FAD-dependent monooxygenase [Sphingomonas turrisvirgatae]|uniref:Monooxygenase n=1 Tax=Sphingomonas turrisvirgatae TaxID=1888892 RepID=A0A1E3LRF4_9SPHN|nr:FAD-dependent monooxygenase [Sphingomonas turrisvirgatae]ODP36313.1 monooxygenase [Sphingomonas turrisvirgatae]
MRQNPGIGIVGGGIGGLTAALALLRKGHEVTVFEQAAQLQEVGAGLQISPNGMRVLFDLGLETAVRGICFEPEGKEIRLWNTGDTWKLFDLGVESQARYGVPYITVHRNDLHQLLVKAVEAASHGAIRLDHRFTAVEQRAGKVVLSFHDKPDATFDAVIGADGVHSKMRELLFGAGPAKFTGIVAWRGVIPAELLPERLVRPIGTNWIGPGGHVIHYPIRRGELINFTSVIERQDWKTESWTSAGTNQEYHDDYPGWHEDVHAYIEAIPQPFKWALIARPPMTEWVNGRVALLGDACHPSLPFLAQGATQALEDACILARTFEAFDTIEEALDSYQRLRIPRTTRAVEGANANAERFHNPTLADPAGAQIYVREQWAHDKVVERYEWLFEYDPTRVPLAMPA